MEAIQSGQVFFTLLSGMVVSVAVTAAFLALYRRAVARTMRSRSARGGIDPTGLIPLARANAAAACPSGAVTAAGLRAAARRTRRRIGAAYVLAFAVSTAVLHLPSMHLLWAESSDGLGLLRAFAWWLPAWSVTLFIVAALLHLTRGQTWQAVAVTVIAGAALTVLVPMTLRLAAGTALDAGLLANAFHFLVAFALNALLPAVLVWTTGRPRLRNVMPLVLVVVMTLSLVVAAVHHLFAQGFADSAPSQIALAGVAAALGPPALVLLLALPAGWLAWRGTAALAARYRARRFSDMQLLADAWWGVIAAFAIALLWRYGGTVALACAGAAWACFFVTVRFLLKVQGAGKGEPGPSLLLLRVFGHQARTERLFDAVAAHWRFTGPVAMIAGADLALRSIDVDDALAFAHGEIESGYVADRADLERRLARLRGQADPDGRHRIEAFFCFDDTWRATLQALLGDRRVVLMDLRGFDRDNDGCLFELEQLGRRGQVPRCVFVTDAATDRMLAERTLDEAAGGRAAPEARWIDMPRDDQAALGRLRDALFEVAAGAR